MSYQQPVDTREAPHAGSILSLSDYPIAPSLNAILAAVSEVTGVSIGDLSGLNTHRRAVDARFAFYLLARQLTAKSYPQIGRVCHRHHSTIISGEHQARLNRAKLKPTVDAVLARLGALE